MAGARPADRPSVDRTLLDERVGDDRGEIIDSQDEVGGYPAYDQTTRSLTVPDSGLLAWIDSFTAAVEQPEAPEPNPDG